MYNEYDKGRISTEEAAGVVLPENCTLSDEPELKYKYYFQDANTLSTRTNSYQLYWYTAYTWAETLIEAYTTNKNYGRYLTAFYEALRDEDVYDVLLIHYIFEDTGNEHAVHTICDDVYNRYLWEYLTDTNLVPWYSDMDTPPEYSNTLPPEYSNTLPPEIGGYKPIAISYRLHSVLIHSPMYKNRLREYLETLRLHEEAVKPLSKEAINGVLRICAVLTNMCANNLLTKNALRQLFEACINNIDKEGINDESVEQ